jgi:hypothetical protein
MAQEIKFGTDGWRGIIADDFTFDNVRRVAGAIASYVLKYEDPQHSVIVGYDTRFASQRAAQIAAEVILCREGQGRCGRSDDHLQPQSMELERREVQGQVWRVGYSSHHEKN